MSTYPTDIIIVAVVIIIIIFVRVCVLFGVVLRYELLLLWRLLVQVTIFREKPSLASIADVSKTLPEGGSLAKLQIATRQQLGQLKLKMPEESKTNTRISTTAAKKKRRNEKPKHHNMTKKRPLEENLTLSKRGREMEATTRQPFSSTLSRHGDKVNRACNILWSHTYIPNHTLRQTYPHTHTCIQTLSTLIEKSLRVFSVILSKRWKIAEDV